MRRFMMVAVLLLTAVMAKAQDNSNRIGVGLGGFYRPAASATLFWEHETHYHNAWEFFAEGRVLFPGDLSQVSQLWDCSGKQWGVGAAWKPCVFRARNRYGSARIGVSLGAAPADFMAGIHAGWQIVIFLNLTQCSRHKLHKPCCTSSTNCIRIEMTFLFNN